MATQDPWTLSNRPGGPGRTGHPRPTHSFKDTRGFLGARTAGLLSVFKIQPSFLRQPQDGPATCSLGPHPDPTVPTRHGLGLCSTSASVPQRPSLPPSAPAGCTHPRCRSTEHTRHPPRRPHRFLSSRLAASMVTTALASAARRVQRQSPAADPVSIPPHPLALDPSALRLPCHSIISLTVPTPMATRVPPRRAQGPTAHGVA